MNDDHEYHLNASFDRIEATAALNAKGIAVKVWDACSDEHDWCYGPLKVRSTHALRIKLGVTEQDGQVAWQTLRQALTFLSLEKRGR